MDYKTILGTIAWQFRILITFAFGSVINSQNYLCMQLFSNCTLIHVISYIRKLQSNMFIEFEVVIC